MKEIDKHEQFVNEVVKSGKYSESSSCIVGSRTFISATRELESYLDKLNAIKAIMDVAHKAGNVEDFTEFHRQYCELLLTKKFSDLKRRVTCAKSWLKSVAVVKDYIRRQVAFISSVRDNGRKEIKRMQMSSKQRAAADAASARMKAQWGMC